MSPSRRLVVAVAAAAPAVALATVLVFAPGSQPAPAAPLPPPSQPAFAVPRPKALPSLRGVSEFAVIRRGVTARAAPAARRSADHGSLCPDTRGHHQHLAAARQGAAGDGRTLAAGAACGTAERNNGVGTALRARQSCAARHAPGRRPQEVQSDVVSRRRPRLQRPGRRRGSAIGNTGRRFLRSRRLDALPQPDLRPDRVRDQRPLSNPDRLAGRRLHRHPRNRSAGLDSGAISHGCIRMRNADILRLAKLMPVGTPVIVR